MLGLKLQFIEDVLSEGLIVHIGLLSCILHRSHRSACKIAKDRTYSVFVISAVLTK